MLIGASLETQGVYRDGPAHFGYSLVSKSKPGLWEFQMEFLIVTLMVIQIAIAVWVGRK